MSTNTPQEKKKKKNKEKRAKEIDKKIKKRIIFNKEEYIF